MLEGHKEETEKCDEITPLIIATHYKTNRQSLRGTYLDNLARVLVKNKQDFHSKNDRNCCDYAG